MIKTALKRLSFHLQIIRFQLFGSVSDYISTRPIPEQIFWYSNSSDGLFKTAMKQNQLYAYLRFFLVHIGGIWFLRIIAFVLAIWTLLYIGFSTIGRV